MRFYNPQHQFYRGVDLHARAMVLCVLDANGAIVPRQNMAAKPESFPDSSPCVIVPDPVCLDWTTAPWPSVLLFVTDIAIDWEAALASSRRLTGPVFGHEPANFAWPRSEDRRIFQGVMLA